MKKTIFSFILFCLSIAVYSQGLSNLWLYGNSNPDTIPYGGGVIDFSNGIMNVYPQTRNMNFYETNCSISDSLGNLLFASNGVFIINAVNDTMLNGSGLSPCVYTSFYEQFGLAIPQANLIIPIPENDFQYYLFHESDDDYGGTYCTLNLYYSIVDMTLENGKGAVIQKNGVLLHDSLVPGRITACKHANGRDWWLFVHQYNTNTFYKFLISPSGISGAFTQSIGEVRGVLFGQNLFSPDGKLFTYYDPEDGDLDIFDFDRCDGTLSLKEHIDINDSAFGGGLAFSSNSNVLYVSSMRYIYQFDLTASNIDSSRLTVGTYDGFQSDVPPHATYFFLSYLAPDNKIYIISGNGVRHLHVINNPDNLGLSCNLCQHCIHLPIINTATIPNYPNYFLMEDPNSICDSLTEISILDDSMEKSYCFPNPVNKNGIVKIKLTFNNDKVNLKVFSSEGRRVKEINYENMINSINLSTSDLNAGSYFISISAGSKTYNVKLIVM